MKKNIFVMTLCFLLLTGCVFNARMNVISSTPGRLTNIRKINNLDRRTSDLFNNFAINIYNELYEMNENLFISPASIYLALAMTYNGANGQTATEMANVLGSGDLSLEQFNQLSRDLQYLILGYEKTKFELANSIWIRDTFEEFVNKDFLNRNKEYYGAMISALDFNDSRAKNTINNWVNKNTKGRIKKAIENDINPLTVMFLINTIYFKADWKTPFEKNKTTDSVFYTIDGEKNIKMMNSINQYGYVENDILQGIMLPYNDNQTSMIVLLPKDDIVDINLNANNINDLINYMKNNKATVSVSMPKIKMEYEKNLKEPLSRLGMPTSFTSLADFSNMATNAAESGLHIADVAHKSFLAIDEKGTEAAAMTKVQMDVTSMPQIDYTMNINRPYIFAIIDNNSNTILFIGTIFKPEL